MGWPGCFASVTSPGPRMTLLNQICICRENSPSRSGESRILMRKGMSSLEKYLEVSPESSGELSGGPRGRERLDLAWSAQTGGGTICSLPAGTTRPSYWS